MGSEIQEWKKAQYILSNHDKPQMEYTQKYLVPGQDQVIKKSLEQTLKWEPEDYKITPELFAPREGAQGKEAHVHEEVKREDRIDEIIIQQPRVKRTIQPRLKSAEHIQDPEDKGDEGESRYRSDYQRNPDD